MDINHIEIGLLKGYSNNTRTHSEEQIQQIAGSIREFGFTNPVLIDGNQRIIAGHGRLAAARVLGLDSIPCISLDHLNDTQVRALVIADNQIAMNAGWDEGLLATELDRLQGDGFDLDLLGFEADDLEELLQSALPEVEGLTDEDDVPEAPEEPVTVEGDIWVLGDHRVMCGDSTSIDAVEKLMDGEKADMVFTDPPYGMNLDVSNSNNLGGKGTWKNKAKNYTPIIGDDGDYDPTHIFQMFPDVKEMFLWGFDYFAEFIPNRKSGSVVVWDKRKGVEDMKLTFSEFELCWSMKKHLREFVRITWSGLLGTEQEFDHKRHHPTQKPIELSVWFIDKYSEKDWTIVDLFLGSGSTLIACEKLNRKCYGMELDPKYCDVIIQRWQDYTGKKAIHEATGMEFGNVITPEHIEEAA